MKVKWIFLKVIIRGDMDFSERKRVLESRFENADTHIRKVRGAERRFQIYDLEIFDQDDRRLAIGHLTRSPKLARGRRLNRRTRKSKEDAVDIDEIADATEFIYDFDSCVLALHRRDPFLGLTTVSKVWEQLLGVPVQVPENETLTDVHAEILRDAEFVESEFDSGERLTEVRLTYARPNPGSGDDSLEKIDLGLIGEDVEADEATFKARRVAGGSLDKSSDGFIRRSIRGLLEHGYMKRGLIFIGGRVVDILEAKEKMRETSGYKKDEEGEPLTLRRHAAKWIRQLLDNHDIYPRNGNA